MVTRPTRATLARLLRLGILPTGANLPAKHREVRGLARKRMSLARSGTSHILAVENTTARRSGLRITSNQVKHPDRALID